MAHLLPYAIQRLSSFIAEIDRSSFESDFPYPDSERALQTLKTLFESKLQRLEGLSPENDPSVVAQQCRLALRDLMTYLPFVGFIIRSTSVRNSFEAFGPFLRLAISVLEPGADMASRNTQIVLSSEWDYSPFMYSRVTSLENFLFIGLPASESGNPLLVPLAGHELGHAVWHHDDLREVFQPKVQAAIVAEIQSNWSEYQRTFSINVQPNELTTNMFAVESWRLASEWCLGQAQETFCDFLGLAIFGESYFHSIGYILSPGLGTRSVRYPDVQTRAANLVSAGPELDAVPPVDFTDLFKDELHPAGASPIEIYLLRLADTALKKQIDDLRARAKNVVDRAALVRSSDEVGRILSRLEHVAPADRCESIADILNAAWHAYNDASFWKQHPKIQERASLVLKELVLKNLEVFEIERIQEQ